jgi:cytochrome c-type biogenesis protein CcmH/NrfF
METNLNKTNQKGKPPKPAALVSTVLPQGQLLEMIYDPTGKQTAFVIWQGDQWRVEPHWEIAPLKRVVPYSPENNLIKHEVVLFPSQPEEYGSENDLLAEIQSFIHRYVDVSPLFEKIACYYVLFSWVYDGFNELPYLRLRGDPGSGKTRFLLTVGSLCYKPIFASGASTVSPLFRIIDAFRGTLIIDEGDFRASDEKAEIVKILNNGNARGFPVLRSEVTPSREFNPTAYTVFGPKLVATRGFFEDRALESRCLTEQMGQHKLRHDVPINLPACHKEEALILRNKLLLFRFRNYHKRIPTEELIDRSIEPRLNQVFAPLLAIIDDTKAREDLQELARRYHREMIADRSADMEAQVLEIVRDLIDSGDSKLSVKDITNWFVDRHGEEYERKITAKWIGNIIRRKLALKTQKSHGVFVIAAGEVPKLPRLYEKYGITPKESGGIMTEEGPAG